jgi:hypothetical protein
LGINAVCSYLKGSSVLGPEILWNRETGLGSCDGLILSSKTAVYKQNYPSFSKISEFLQCEESMSSHGGSYFPTALKLS